MRRVPLPQPDSFTAPFWSGVAHQKILVQKCQGCGKLRHPPSGAPCGQCQGSGFLWAELSGRGTVYSHQRVHDSRVGVLRDDQPFAVLVVQMEESEDLLLIGNLLPLDGQVQIGATVSVCFEEVQPGGQFLPQFKMEER